MASLIVLDAVVSFTKEIVPVWEKQGRRRRIVGFHALLNTDPLLIPGSLITPRMFDCPADAERALDEAALELIQEAATTADLQALPFEPTAYELSELRAACDDRADEGLPEADTSTTCFRTSDGALFRVITITPAHEQQGTLR